MKPRVPPPRERVPGMLADLRLPGGLGAVDGMAQELADHCEAFAQGQGTGGKAVSEISLRTLEAPDVGAPQLRIGG